MDIINIILFLIAIINFLWAIFIFSNNPKNKINIYYSLMMVMAVFWTVGLAIYRMPYFINNKLIIIQFIYFFAALIAFFYFYLTLHFPFKDLKSNHFLKIIINLLTLIISILVLFNKNFLLHSAYLPLEKTNFIGYLTYTLFFFFTVISGIFILINKNKSSEGLAKAQITYLLMGTIIAFCLASVTNLILGFFDNYDYFWLGPIFTISNLICVGYYLFFKPTLNRFNQ